MRDFRIIRFLLAIAMCLLTGCSVFQNAEGTKKVSLLSGVEEYYITKDTPFLKNDFQYNEYGMMIKRTETKHDETYVFMENTYDSEGKLLCRVYPTLDRTDIYDNNGKILTKQQGDIIESYTYDSFGNVLSRKTVEAGTVTYEYNSTYEYDENGRMIRNAVQTTDHQNQNDHQYQNLYKYDADGQLIHQCVIEQNGLESNTYYTYDEKGNKTSVDHVSYYGSRETSIYTYDTEGRLLEQTVQYPEYTWVTVNSYDDEGNLIKTQHYQNDKLMRTVQYTYSRIPGQKLSVSVDYGRSQTEERFTYDKDGNVLSREFVDGFGWTYSYRFHYVTATVPATFADAVETEQNSLIEVFLNKDHTAIAD